MILGKVQCPAFVQTARKAIDDEIGRLDGHFVKKAHALFPPSLAALVVKVMHAAPWALLFLGGRIYVRIPLFAGIFLIRTFKPILYRKYLPPERRINILNGSAIYLAITAAKTASLFIQTGAAWPWLALTTVKVGFCAFAIIRARSLEAQLNKQNEQDDKIDRINK